MILTDEQIFEIKRIIADHHSAFIVNAISPQAVPPEMLEKLKAKGLVDPSVSSAQDSYLYGVVLAMLNDPKASKMTYAQFSEHLRANPIPLSEPEIRSIEMAQHKAAQYAVGLANKITTHTTEAVDALDRDVTAQMIRGEIQTATAKNIANRESVRKLKSDLGWKRKDWSRDWDRIAVTEKNTAMQRGSANHYAKEYGKDVLVFKRPMPDACPNCVKAYLVPGTNRPKVFKLSDLEGNGSNFGKKTAEWLPTVGGLHPNCQCMLVRMPEGWGFDLDGELLPDGKFLEVVDDLGASVKEESDLQKAFALQGKAKIQGLFIAIENKKGTKRQWTDSEGNQGETLMQYAYGYVEGTEGMDGDEIDVFIGPNPKSEMVYVIHQQNPSVGTYDEDKCMVGFSDEVSALTAYRDHYNRSDFDLAVSPMAMDHFQRWIATTKTKEKPTYVLPLQKSLTTGTIVSKEYAAKDSPAGGRAPGPNVAVNYLFNIPSNRQANKLPDKSLLSARTIFEDVDDRRKMVKRDKSVYDLESEVKLKVRPVELADDVYGNFRDPEDIAIRKKQIEDEAKKKLRRPKNTVEVG